MNAEVIGELIAESIIGLCIVSAFGSLFLLLLMVAFKITYHTSRGFKKWVDVIEYKESE